MQFVIHRDSIGNPSDGGTEECVDFLVKWIVSHASPADAVLAIGQIYGMREHITVDKSSIAVTPTITMSSWKLAHRGTPQHRQALRTARR